MKNLTKIIGLLSLVFMVSCGSNSPRMENVGDCINGDIEICNEMRADFVMTDIKTITYGTDPVYTFDKLTALGVLKFKTGTIIFGGEGEGWREILVNENGEMIFNIWLGTEADKTLYWSSPIEWSFEENDLLIDGASITYTTF